MQIRKPGLLLTLVTITSLAAAQTRFGFFAGPQVTQSKYTILNVKQPNDQKAGFQAGVTWKIPFEAPLYFSPAAFYSLKGYKVTYNRFVYPPDTAATDNNTTIHTFELAFLFQADLSKKATHAYIKLGPSLDFQLFGTEKFHSKTGGLVDRNMPFGFTGYGHFGANMLLQFGVETKKGLIFFAQYSHGLASINNADHGPAIRHRVLGISIGKYLGGKKKG